MKATELEKFYNLIYKIVNQFPQEDRGDLFNICYLELYDLLEKYDETLGTFQNFAYKRLYYSCKDYIAKMQTYELTLDDFIRDENGYEDGSRYSDYIADENEAHYDYLMEQEEEVIESQLTPIENLIRRKYREGMTVENIALVLSPYTHIKSIRQIRTIINK